MKKIILALSLQLLLVPTLFASGRPPYVNQRVGAIQNPTERQDTISSFFSTPKVPQSIAEDIEAVSGMPARNVSIAIEVVNRVEVLSSPTAKDADVKPVLKQTHTERHGRPTAEHQDRLNAAHKHIMTARKASDQTTTQNAKLKAMIQLMAIENGVK